MKQRKRPDNAAEAFEAVKALALDPANAITFIWLAEAAVKHFRGQIREQKDRILRLDRFGPEPDEEHDELDRSTRRLDHYRKALDIAEAVADWVRLSEIEHSAPLVVAAVRAQHEKPDIKTTGRKVGELKGGKR